MALEPPAAFFSYSRDDSAFTLRLAEDLKAAGASVWLDQLELEHGKPWDIEIQKALVACPRMVVVLSPASATSANVLDEVSFALNRHKTVLPVLHRECEIPYRLERLQHIDFRTDYASGLKTLLKSLGVQQSAASAAVADAPLEQDREPAAQRAQLEPERKRIAKSVPVKPSRRADPTGLLRRRIACLKANWKWSLPAALVATLVFAGVVIYLLGNSEVSKLAIAQAQSNPGVIQRLGEPLQRGWWTSGGVDSSSSSGNAELVIPISGPKGRGTLYLVATKSPGRWTFQTLQLKVDGEDNRLDLLQSAAPLANAPVGQSFTPQFKDPYLADTYQKAMAGNPAAMNEVGNYYLNGNGVAKDSVQAVAWYRKAADAGNMYGMGNLCASYESGDGLPKDPKQAFEWCQKAADAGNTAAMTALAGMYEDGSGVKRDHRVAALWYREAAEFGNQDAQAALVRLGEGSALGSGIPKFRDPRIADAYRRALAGDSSAMFTLGYAYDFDEGVEGDNKKAFTWYRKAAEAGNEGGMAETAKKYEIGEGVPKDYKLAVFWYRKLAESDSTSNGFDTYKLGFMYENGYGVAKDLKMAITWYRKAAQRGSDDAKGALKRLGESP